MVHKKFHIIYGPMLKGKNITSLVVQAVKVGYTSIDTANVYGDYRGDTFFPDEKGIAAAIQQLLSEGFDRDSIWIQTKYTFPGLWSDVTEEKIRDLILAKFHESKARLGTTIDSYILHCPYQQKSNTLHPIDLAAWTVFEELYKSGEVKSIGVSNFVYDQISELYSESEVKPMVLQNFYGVGKLGLGDWHEKHSVSEFNIQHHREQDKILSFCKQHNIQFQSFNNKVSEDKLSVVEEIAASHNVSAKQVIYRYESQLGIVPITGTANINHLKENIALEQFTLSASEMLELGVNVTSLDEEL